MLTATVSMNSHQNAENLDLSGHTGHTDTTKSLPQVQQSKSQPLVEGSGIEPLLELVSSTLASSSVRMEHQ
jgi:hypothetical protein